MSVDGQSDHWWSSLKKMRILWINITLVLLCIFAAEAKAGGFDNIKFGGSVPESFDIDLKALLKTHINLSLKYLYTGVGYGNQKVEKPGMAKHLRDLSDDHWEEGLDALKKYFKRGGTTKNLYNSMAFNFNGKNEISATGQVMDDMRMPYLKTLKTLVQDSRECTDQLNRLHKMAVSSADYHDGDWGHYIEEKLEKGEKRTRKMMGDVTNLEKMISSSLALHFFDSNL